ncbi:MAG: hypothetical protein ACR2QU_01145 [Gammaproteobacteria bacterium]
MSSRRTGRITPLPNTRALIPRGQSVPDSKTNNEWCYWQTIHHEHRYLDKVTVTTLG